MLSTDMDLALLSNIVYHSVNWYIYIYIYVYVYMHGAVWTEQKQAGLFVRKLTQYLQSMFLSMIQQIKE